MSEDEPAKQMGSRSMNLIVLSLRENKTNMPGLLDPLDGLYKYVLHDAPRSPDHMMSRGKH